MINQLKHGDIDIDISDRTELLQHINAINASIRKDSDVRKHNTGIYPTAIPYDPLTNMAALDYSIAERRGYVKIDLLNVGVYKLVKNEEHLVALMREPDWTKLQDQQFVEKLIHLANHFYVIQQMPEPVNSIPRLAMLLSVIRPGKKHLIGKTWKEVAETVWDKTEDGYTFKKAHGIAYAQLVVVHINLLTEMN